MTSEDWKISYRLIDQACDAATELLIPGATNRDVWAVLLRKEVEE